MRDPAHPAAADLRLADVLHALADPVRLEMVARLAAAGGTLSYSVVGGDIEMHKSTLSHHYRVLREAGVTRTTVDGRTRSVELRRADLDGRFPGLLDAVLRAQP